MSLIYNGQPANWEEYKYGGGNWFVISTSPYVGYLATANRDGRWNAKRPTTDGNDLLVIAEGEAGNLEAAKAAAEKALLDAGILTLPSVPPVLLYKGRSTEWKVEGDGWRRLYVEGYYCHLAAVNRSGLWSAYDLTGKNPGCFKTIALTQQASQDEGVAAAVKCLLDNGILTTVAPAKPKPRPVVGTYTFHFRADRGGATAVAAVVRGPTDTTVIYGVTFCSPKDGYDKNLGRRVAAYRLIAEPSSLSIPGDAAPREIKAAVFDALDIPPGNRLVR